MFMAERFVQGVIEDAARHLIKGRCIRGNGLLQKVVNHGSLPHVLSTMQGIGCHAENWIICSGQRVKWFSAVRHSARKHHG